MKRCTQAVFTAWITVVCVLGYAGPLASEAWAAGTGEAGYDIWVDGPDEVQPGVGRNFPDAAVDPSGNLVFVWSAFSAAGGNRNDIFMRRFDAEGTALADPVMVNTTFDDDQSLPRIAISNDGSFLVIWQSDEEDPDLGIDREFLRSQAFDAKGDALGTE